jgi:hypothetical protein
MRALNQEEQEFLDRRRAQLKKAKVNFRQALQQIDAAREAADWKALAAAAQDAGRWEAEVELDERRVYMTLDWIAGRKEEQS